ncbi:TLD-domain-containing protein [Neoconidiobolus thromboides FSU 785]|nr:TLD-domain-containing protein [Neoconidiobolus thromboides FSU 785]
MGMQDSKLQGSQQGLNYSGIKSEYIQEIQALCKKYKGNEEELFQLINQESFKQKMKQFYNRYVNNQSSDFQKFVVYCIKEDNQELLNLLLTSYSSISELLDDFLLFYLSQWSNSEITKNEYFNNLKDFILKADQKKEEIWDEIESEVGEDEVEMIEKEADSKIKKERIEEYYIKNIKLKRVILGSFYFLFFKHDNRDINLKFPNIKNNILDVSLIYFFNQKVGNSGNKEEWKIKYDSKKDGKSWNRFKKELVECEQSIIIIYEKKSNYCFGGFTDNSWKKDGHFSGTGNEALFSIIPKLGWYSTTNYNKNFKYFMDQSQTLVNGLGFGGQLNYFGLFLETNFNNGHSKAHPNCSTFNSPQLSKNEEFEIEHVQILCLKQIENEEGGSNQKSILDNNEAAAFLEMANHKIYSKDLREEKLDIE